MSSLVLLHQGAIGDFLLTLSVVQGVRAVLGADRVTAVASAPSARVAVGRSAIDEWISPEDVGLYRLFCADLALNERLSSLLAGADHVLNCLGGPGETIHSRLQELAGERLVSVDPRPTPETREHRRHITDQWAGDVRSAGWPAEDPTPVRIRISRARAAGGSRVLIHPGSGGRAKCWPMESFIRVAESLAGVEVTWMLGPAEAAQSRLLDSRDEPVLVEEDLGRAAEAMAGFDVYVGNDSGMTHLAAAVGVPTVVVFGVTDPLIWRPLGEHVSVVAPAHLEERMESVGPDAVRSAVLDGLRRSQGIR